MKVFISTDFEGVAGIVDWDQILIGSHDYDLGRRLLLGEVNAAIDGALEAGAEEIVVNDSHSSMRNLEPDLLHGRASLILGKHKPLYMMEGLDSSFGAAIFLGYHGSIGASKSILSHTYNPRAIWEVRLNGTIVGESALNALVAAHFRVPIVLVTGDQATSAEASQLNPSPRVVEVKRSISRFAAESVHPETARDLIRMAAVASLRAVNQDAWPVFGSPVELEVTFLTADMADMASWLHGVEQSAERARTVRFVHDQPMEVFRTFVTMVMLTRALVE